MSANRAPPGVAPDDDGGYAGPRRARRTRPPRVPAGRTGLAERSRALEAPRPLARSGGLTRRPRRSSAVKTTRASTRRTVVTTLTVALRREHEAGVDAASKAASVRRASSPRDAPNFRRTTHFSKNEHPSSTSLSGPHGLSPRGPVRVALHGASLASDHRSSQGESAFCSGSASEQAFL
jgi:hypothetical protein